MDGMYNNFPSLTKDQYWNDIDFKMPYTLETENLRDTKPFKGSVVDLTYVYNQLLMLNNKGTV